MGKEYGIKKKLELEFPEYCIALLDTVESTQNVARNLLLDCSKNVIVLAEMQTAGRGRHGRRWVSESRKNVYLSIGFLKVRSKISLGDYVVHLAENIAATFNKNFAITLDVKAPNDLLLNGTKVCGMLAETFEDNLVIGIGMNLSYDATLQLQCSQLVGSIDLAMCIDKSEIVPLLCECAISSMVSSCKDI
jgi:BirA family biotin operon repressor/biotin-[acetyl-CoA-carboxylase] ligase